MDANKRQRYEKIAEDLTRLAGGKDNIQGMAHCATRLRIVLKDNDLADLKAMENVDLAKGVFVAGDQVQIIFGAGLVNDVYEVIADYNGMQGMSLGELKTVASKKMNPLQRIIKALSDVFVDIMPGILAAALLTGLSGVLGNLDVVQNNETLFAINKLIGISSGAIFGFLPLAVAYSACKRFGGRPILGIVMGCIMLSGDLANAYSAAQGTVDVTTLHLFGFPVELVGFQGGIIVALLMGWVVANLDKFFEKKVPEVVRLLISPLLTTLTGALLLFTVIGPVGRGLSSALTAGLMWMTENLGVVGYAAFSGLQQLLVITGLHHIIGAVEAQLIADTGFNFINPLMSVAIIAQGGAVLAYLIRHRDNAKTRELCLPSFVSVLFGITEPALFGVNLRYRYPIIGGCIGGAFGGVMVYITKLTATGFGTTVVPGIALTANGNYTGYVIAHAVSLVAGFIFAMVLGGFMDKAPDAGENSGASASTTPALTPSETPTEETFFGYAKGTILPLEEVKDETFASKVLGDGVAVQPSAGQIFAPVDAVVTNLADTKHAIGLQSRGGNEILIHIGIDTVQLGGKFFKAHVKDGDTVQKGQLLIEFDLEQIKKAGFGTTIPMLFTDAPDDLQLIKETSGEMTLQTKIAEFKKA